jgi:hypothetical protein
MSKKRCLVVGMVLVDAGRGKNGKQRKIPDQTVWLSEDWVMNKFAGVNPQPVRMMVTSFDHLTKEKLAKSFDQLKRKSLQLFDQLAKYDGIVEREQSVFKKHLSV